MRGWGWGSIEARLGLGLLLSAGCGSDEPAVGETGPGTLGDPTTTETGQDSNDSSSSGSETESEGESETGPGEPLCEAIDVSIVIEPAAPIYGADDRSALAAFLDGLVADTGAAVRIHLNVGTELLLETDCLDELDIADGRVLEWGTQFEPHPEATDALDCLMDAGAAWESEIEEGNWLFSGLMFPILFQDPQWPTPDVDQVGFAMFLVDDDDDLGNMYSRPGMAAESYLRHVADEDRRRASAFAFSDNSDDEMELFALTLGPHARHYDTDDWNLPAALEDWRPHAVQACEEHDKSNTGTLPEGCTKMDILFVIDGSLSMNDEKEALQGLGGEDPVFALFTDALLEELEGIEDFHVGVISSEPDDIVLHTHRNFPELPESPETDCGLPDGERWLVGPSDTLEEDFACLAATSSDHTWEFTVENAGRALGEPANEGFLREDSVLVVVLLSDEDTQSENPLRVPMREAILEAVDDRLDRLVVLAIIGDQGVFEEPKTTCQGLYGAAVPGRRTTSIVYSLRDQGLVDNICDGTLGQAFEDAIETVVTTCEEYDPEG